MTEARTITLVALLAALAAAPAAAQTSTSSGQAGTSPASPKVDTFQGAIEQTRPNTQTRPHPESEVAVLHLMLEAEAGRLKRAQVERLMVANANPPKVFARSRGTWEVRLQGRETVTYRIPNPLEDIEVENPPGSTSPFSQVKPEGMMPFDIVVPLSRGGSSLGVERIQVRDTVTGQLVIDTPVRR
jgi:hypothetical protein